MLTNWNFEVALLGVVFAFLSCANCRAVDQAVEPTSTIRLQDRNIQSFPAPESAVDNDAISKHKSISRAKMEISSSLRVEVVEKPDELVNYNSFVLVYRNNRKLRSFDIGKIIGDRALRLAHAVLLKSSEQNGVVVLEFEGGAVGAVEGFAVLRYSPASTQLHPLPLTDYGKIVLFRSRPNFVELWSGDCDSKPADVAYCEYSKRLCSFDRDRYRCSAPRSMGRVQGDSDPGIEIQ